MAADVVSTRLTPGTSARAEFPIFERAVYANSCSQGALANRVRAAAEEWLAGWDQNGAEWEYWVERNEAARASFAGLLHAEPDDVLAARPGLWRVLSVELWLRHVEALRRAA